MSSRVGQRRVPVGQVCGRRALRGLTGQVCGRRALRGLTGQVCGRRALRGLTGQVCGRRALRGLTGAVAIVLLGVALFGACSETASPGGGAACVPGQTIQCGEIDGCAAVQRCLPDLTGFGECQCESDAAPPGDASDIADAAGDGADAAGDSP